MNMTYSENKAAVVVIILTMILVSLDRMNLGGAVILTAYWGCIKIFCWTKNSSLRMQITPALIVISIALLAHKIPGFNNILFYNNINISPISAPYSAYINFDKPFLMLLLAYYYIKHNKYQNPILVLYRALYLGLIASAVLLASALLTGYLKLDPKIPTILTGWIILNLITVIAEEALFRGFLQNALNDVLGSSNVKYHAVLSLIITSTLFGMMHHAGGNMYMFLSFIAGLFYGYAMMLTKRIEASIIVHFGVNLVHMLLFTYPYASA